MQECVAVGSWAIGARAQRQTMLTAACWMWCAAAGICLVAEVLVGWRQQFMNPALGM
jgi:hypothetical protein